MRSPAGSNGETAVFSASGKVIEFAGFRRAYVEGSDDPMAELGEQESALPKLSVGEIVAADAASRLHLVALDAKGHETTPPARYTEASLIKELERLGHRTAVDLRVNDRDHRTARLHLPTGQGAGAELYGVCGHAAAADPFQ